MIHKVFSEDLQCLVNAINKNNYVPPHKHDNFPDRCETFTVERGHFWIILFDESGNITEKVKLDAGDPKATKSFEVKTGVIHTVVSDSPFVTLELKQHPKGGYDSKTDKVFPEWAVRENDEKAPEYFKYLLQEVVKN